MNGDDNIQEESLMSEDGGDYSKTKEVNFEIILEYDPTYPLMLKWTKDHLKTQIIGNPATSVLTHAQ